MNVSSRPMPRLRGLVLLAVVLLSGCDYLGIETPEDVRTRIAAKHAAEGAACRHVGMSLLECMQLKEKSSPAAMLSGWREMDQYMRENNIPNAPKPEGVLAKKGDGKGDEKPGEGEVGKKSDPVEVIEKVKAAKSTKASAEKKSGTLQAESKLDPAIVHPNHEARTNHQLIVEKGLVQSRSIAY